MKASELIERLQESVRLHGDMEVVGGPKESAIDEIQVTNPSNALPKMRLRKGGFAETPLVVCGMCSKLTRELMHEGYFNDRVCPSCHGEMHSAGNNFARLLGRGFDSVRANIQAQKRDWLAAFKESKQKAKS